MKNSLRIVCLLGLISVLNVEPSYAYIGPGSGVTAIGAVLAVIGTFLLILVGLLLWPLRLLWRWIKSKKEGTSPDETQTEEKTSEPPVK